MSPSASDPTHTPHPNLPWIVRGLWLTVIGYSCVCMYGLFVGRPAWNERGPEVLTALVAGGALTIARRRPVLAAWIGMGTVWLQLTHNTYKWGTFVDPGFICYPPLVAVTGLLVGGRAALIMGAVSLIGIPLAGYAGGMTWEKMHADSGNQGLWLLVTALSIIVSAILTRTALKSYGDLLATSERERSRYLGLFENAPDGLLGLDAKGVIVEANAAAARLLGRDRRDLTGRNITGILQTAGIGPEFDLTRAARNLFELTLSRGGEDAVSVEVSVQKTLTPDGATLLMLRDITQRKLIEQRIGHAQRLEAVGQLAGGIAHDFNNLLTGIGGSAELIMTSPDQEARGFAAVILEAQRRGSSLTRQLLAFARRDVHQPESIDLAATVTGMTKLIERVLGEQHRLRFVRAEPVAISADAAQIEQVVLNLVTNARDAMPAGGDVRVTLGGLTGPAARTLGSKLESEWQALLEVADRGVGIPQKLQTRIFEPFFTTKERGKGTGLGLAAVQGIVIQNQGCLSLESTPGSGATFRIFFPASRLGQDAVGASVAPSIPGPVAVAPRSRGRILLVDDEELVRQAAARMLEREGYDVRVATNGEEALRLLAESGPFRLVLTDLAMPGMTGRELGERIRAMHPGLPLIFMSGYFEEQGQADALAGASFLSKPFSWEQLVRAVRQACEA